MSPEQNGTDPKTLQTGISGRESVFDRQLREYRNTGGFAKPQRKTLQFIKNPTAEFNTPSMDSKFHACSSENEKFTEIERQAFMDESSGLLNSRTIMGKVAIEMRRQARYNHNFSILILELDGFANLDSMTPLAVELISLNFCKIVSRNVREADLVGRFDRASVLVICPETNLSEAIIEANRLRHVISMAHPNLVGYHNAMTTSVGIASYPEHGNAAVDMLGAAMKAAQQAVAAGGNTVCAAAVDAFKAGQKLEALEEDFSPSTRTEMEDDGPAEDMSPGADTSSTEILAFPAAAVSPVII